MVSSAETQMLQDFEKSTVLGDAIAMVDMFLRSDE